MCVVLSSVVCEYLKKKRNKGKIKRVIRICRQNVNGRLIVQE